MNPWKKLALAVIVSGACLRAYSQQVTLTIITNAGGFVTGAASGSYAEGANVSLGIQADSQHYISSLSSSHPNLGNFQEQYNGIALDALVNNVAPDFTVITSDSESFTINTDTTVTITFSPLAPTITKQPTDQTLLAGNDLTLTTGAGGRFPIAYQWQKDGTNISGATSANLVLTGLGTGDSGLYGCIITNAFGLTNTIAANVSVKDIFVLINGAPVIGAAVTNDDGVYVDLESDFPNGQILYTLDGSDPDFFGTPYNGSFYVSASSTLCAIAYSDDFFDSDTIEPLSIVIIPTYVLDVSGGGGSVTLVPPDGIYESNTVVTAIAEPGPGWTFLGWSGDLGGTNPTNTITMTEDSDVCAIFGTTLQTTTAGGGSISALPAFTIYPYGYAISLTAIPNSTNFFALWGNAARGSQNPMEFDVTSTQAVSALFAPLPSTNVILTTLTDNGGYVIVAPAANFYSVGSTNVLTAVPNSGEKFLGWSGDVSNAVNPLSVVMDKSKTVQAHFTCTPALGICLSKNSAQLTLTGVAGTYQIETSTNLLDWNPLCVVTNYFGAVQFSDIFSPANPVRMYRGVP